MYAQPTHTFITIPGADIVSGDVLKRLPGVPVVGADPVDPEFPHSRTLHMADGSLYFIDPAQGYVVAREMNEPFRAAPLHANTLLVTGPCSTPTEVADLTAHAFDVTDQLGVNTIVATSTSHLVSDYAGVVVSGPSLTAGAKGRQMDIVAAVLEGEAIAHRVPVIVPQAVTEAAPCDACGQRQTIATVRSHYEEVFCADCRGDAPGCSWCLEDDETEPVYTGTGFAPMCAPCANVEKARQPSAWNLTALERATAPDAV
ncbi:hypothetical protein [Streptomyces sp. NPDC014734]|uniref:hypothetical protein n=1 Tax=Streptomyces sp. NPDC014734 TaxID=3364886 RepID=UPI0036F69569